MLSWQALDCPTCGARKGDRCRTLITNRTTDTHTARMDAYDQVRFRGLRQKGWW